MRLANAVGALCVTGVGAAGNVGSLADTLAFIERARPKPAAATG